MWNRRSTSCWSQNERNGRAGRVRSSEWSEHHCHHGSSRSAWRVTGSSSTRSSASIVITHSGCATTWPRSSPDLPISRSSVCRNLHPHPGPHRSIRRNVGVSASVLGAKGPAVLESCRRFDHLLAGNRAMARFQETERRNVTFSLWGLNFCGRVLEFGDQLLKFSIVAEVLQIVVGHQTIGIFILAIDGLLQILESVIGAVGNRCHTGEGIPHREWVSSPLELSCFSVTSRNSLLLLTGRRNTGHGDPAVECSSPFRRALVRIFPGIFERGSTELTAPHAIAIFGIPNTTQVASS